MTGIPKIASLGGALDAIGRAAVPSAPAPAWRSVAPTTQTAFDDLLAVFGTTRTIEEARVDHAAASGWQQRAPTFGRALGLVFGVALGAIAIRTVRTVLLPKAPEAPSLERRETNIG